MDTSPAQQKIHKVLCAATQSVPAVYRVSSPQVTEYLGATPTSPPAFYTGRPTSRKPKVDWQPPPTSDAGLNRLSPPELRPEETRTPAYGTYQLPQLRLRYDYEENEERR